MLLKVGDLRLDRATLQVWRRETPIELSPKEFSLLEALMFRPGQVVPRATLLEQGWGYNYDRRSINSPSGRSSATSATRRRKSPAHNALIPGSSWR